MSSFANRFKIKSPCSMMSEEEKKRIHEAALDVMENTGVRIHSETARASLKKEGAIIAPNGKDVKFPPGLVNDLIKKAPSKIVLAGRTPEYDLPLDGTHSYYTTDGCGIQVWDSVNGVRRKSLLEDIRKTAVISDFLDYVSIYEPTVVAQDVPEKTHVVHGVKVSMENTSKHILTESTTKPAEARAQIRMASEVVGGMEELRKKHYVSAMVCTMSPLVLEGPSTEAAMVWSESHVPVHITGMAQTGVSGPVTIAGDLVVNHAETLALVAAMQAHEPGAPCLYGSVLSSLDPVTGSYMGGSPESTILCAASVEMGKYCKLPISTGGLGSGAKVPGTRASLENALSAAVCAMVGGEVVNGLGVIDGSTLLSYEQLLFDNEIAGMTVKIFAGFDVNDDALAVDLIKKVGIAGTYLSQRHTMMHIRDFYKPFAWGSYGTDELTFSGRGDHVEQARDKIAKILKDHAPEPLDSDVVKRLDGIVEDFGRS